MILSDSKILFWEINGQNLKYCKNKNDLVIDFCSGTCLILRNIWKMNKRHKNTHFQLHHAENKISSRPPIGSYFWTRLSWRKGFLMHSCFVPLRRAPLHFRDSCIKRFFFTQTRSKKRSLSVGVTKLLFLHGGVENSFFSWGIPPR